MTRGEYDAAPGLSQSMLKDLAISPLRMWHRWLRPDREPEEPTAAMRVGSAVHAAVLEPGTFDARYACEMIPPKGSLDTMDDLRGFLRENGQTPKGTRKADVIAQVQAFAPLVPICEVLYQQHAAQHAGKVICKADEWANIQGAKNALLEEPKIQEILKTGEAEKPLFSVDADTGVRLKGVLDWDRADLFLDLKTFTQREGKSIDQSIAADIYWRRYHHQAVFYSILKGWPKWQGDCVLAFVESEPPHETRIKAIRPKLGGQVAMLWERPRQEIRGLIRLYRDCMEHFGPDKPWRYAAELSQVDDLEIPALSF